MNNILHKNIFVKNIVHLVSVIRETERKNLKEVIVSEGRMCKRNQEQ